MAKGLRSSRNKANNVKLRSNVFGPAEDARKERLSAKLLELASQPKPKREDDAPILDENKDTRQQAEIITEGEAHADEEEMDIDQGKESTSTSKRSSGRIQKKGRYKAKAAMVFPVYRKGRRTGPRLSKMQRKKSLRP